MLGHTRVIYHYILYWKEVVVLVREAGLFTPASIAIATTLGWFRWRRKQTSHFVNAEALKPHFSGSSELCIEQSSSGATTCRNVGRHRANFDSHRRIKT